MVLRPSPLKFGWLRMLKNSARNSSMPRFSQEPELCVLHERKVPIPFGRPAQDIAPGCAKLAYSVDEQFVSPGPVQFGVIENMAGLNHWLGLPVMTVLGL